MLNYDQNIAKNMTKIQQLYDIKYLLKKCTALCEVGKELINQNILIKLGFKKFYLSILTHESIF